jgi:hypothetical protein
MRVVLAYPERANFNRVALCQVPDFFAVFLVYEELQLTSDAQSVLM